LARGIGSTMSLGWNGPDQTVRKSTRRFRVDDIGAIVTRNSLGPSASAVSRSLHPGYSGRRLVIGAGFTLLLIWGTLYLVFREWRARYRERALYGATQVLPAIDRLRAITPTNVDPVQWRKAVDQTGSMLITVTGSNLLDVKDMDKLRVELDQHVARATDRLDTAVQELALIWDKIADRGEFLFTDSRSLSGVRHPRPNILPRPSPSLRATSLRRGEAQITQ
jgi:hypothetical protein